MNINTVFQKYRVVERDGIWCRWHIQRRKWLFFWHDEGIRFSCKEHAELEIKLREQKRLVRIFRDGIGFPLLGFGIQIRKTKLRGVGIWTPDGLSICIGFYFAIRFTIF